MALERKKLTRAGHRSSTTKLLTKINDTLMASPVDRSRLSPLKLSLNEKLTVLKTLDDEIVDLVSEGDLAAEIEQADEYKGRIHEAIAQMDEELLTTRRSPGTVSSPATTPSSHKVKLPKISLPRFGGNLLKWPSFWDSYESAVHHSPDLTDIDKFNYLRSLLDGAAHDAIAGLTLTSANYQEAVQILQKRF